MVRMPKIFLDNKGSHILLVTGCYRSGTTAMAAALNRHKDIFCSNEMRVFSKNFLFYFAKNNKGIPGDDRYMDMEKWLAENKKIVTSREYFDIANICRKNEAKPKIFGDKLPAYLNSMVESLDYIKSIWEVYPKIILMYRDPRDVIESQVRRWSSPGAVFWTHPDPISAISSFPSWLDRMTAWSDFRNKFDIDCIEIRYESLLDRPVETAESLAIYLDVDVEEMKEVLTSGYSNERSNRGKWKEKYPDLTDLLPEKWKIMMEKYSIPI